MPARKSARGSRKGPTTNTTPPDGLPDETLPDSPEQNEVPNGDTDGTEEREPSESETDEVRTKKSNRGKTLPQKTKGANVKKVEDKEPKGKEERGKQGKDVEETLKKTEKTASKKIENGVSKENVKKNGVKKARKPAKKYYDDDDDEGSAEDSAEDDDEDSGEEQQEPVPFNATYVYAPGGKKVPEAAMPSMYQVVVNAVQASKDRKGATLASIKKFYTTSYPDKRWEYAKPRMRKAVMQALEEGAIQHTNETANFGLKGRFKVKRLEQEGGAKLPKSKIQKTTTATGPIKTKLAAASKTASKKNTAVTS